MISRLQKFRQWIAKVNEKGRMGFLLSLSFLFFSFPAFADGELTVTQQNLWVFNSMRNNVFLFARVENTGDEPVTAGNGTAAVYDAHDHVILESDEMEIYCSRLEPGEHTYCVFGWILDGDDDDLADDGEKYAEDSDDDVTDSEDFSEDSGVEEEDGETGSKSRFEELQEQLREAAAAGRFSVMIDEEKQRDEERQYRPLRLPVMEEKLLIDDYNGLFQENVTAATVMNNTEETLYQINTVSALTDLKGNILYVCENFMGQLIGLTPGSSVVVKCQIPTEFWSSLELEEMEPLIIDTISYVNRWY